MKLSLILLVLAATVITSSINIEASSISFNHLERRGISSFFSSLFGGGGSSSASIPSSVSTTSLSSGPATSSSWSQNSRFSTVSSRKAKGREDLPASGSRTSSSGAGVSGGRASAGSRDGDTFQHDTPISPVLVGGYVPMYEEEIHSHKDYKSGAGSIFARIGRLALASVGAAGTASILLVA